MIFDRKKIKRHITSKVIVCNVTLIGILIIFVLFYIFVLFPKLYDSFQMKQIVNELRTTQEIFFKDEDIDIWKVQNKDIQMNLMIDKRNYKAKLYGGSFGITLDKMFSNKIQHLFLQYFGNQNISLKDYRELEKEEKNQLFDEMISSIYRTSIPGIEISFANTLEVENSQIDFQSENAMIMSRQIANKEMREYEVVGIVISENYIVYSFMKYPMKSFYLLPLFLSFLITILIYFIIVNIIFSEYIVRTIVKPIKKISELSKFQAEHKKFEPILHSRNDEIGQLMDNLNELHSKLYDYTAYLQNENKQKDIFIKASSHQLKTPIASAIMLTNSMMDKVGKYKDRDRFLPVLKEELLHIKKMVDRILRMNTYDENKKTTLDIRQLCQNMIEKYRTLIEKNHLTYEIKGELVVHLNEDMIVFILDNLIENAIKYTQDSKVQILLESNCIKVINYNASIQKENLQYIFEPFFREVQDNTGTGLGLYVSKYYARKMGLELNVITENNNVTFYINLPI